MVSGGSPDSLEGGSCYQVAIHCTCRNGVLKAGDRILKISWNDVSLASQMEALSHLKASEDVCMLEIEYDVTVHSK